MADNFLTSRKYFTAISAPVRFNVHFQSKKKLTYLLSFHNFNFLLDDLVMTNSATNQLKISRSFGKISFISTLYVSTSLRRADVLLNSCSVAHKNSKKNEKKLRMIPNVDEGLPPVNLKPTLSSERRNHRFLPTANSV